MLLPGDDLPLVAFQDLLAVPDQRAGMTGRSDIAISNKSLGNLPVKSLPLLDASRRLRRPPGRPRAVASQASAPLATPPLARAGERAVAELWPIQPRLLGLKDAALYLSVSTWTLRDWLARGIVARVEPPGADGKNLERLLFDRLDLDALVDAWKGQP
jgi:hypothetical protein